MQLIIPAAAILTSTHPAPSDIQLRKIKAKSRRGTQEDLTAASVAGDQNTCLPEEIIYVTPKGEPVRDDDDYDYVFLEEDAKKFGKEIADSIASPYLRPYVYNRLYLTRNTVCIRMVIYLRLAIPRCS